MKEYLKFQHGSTGVYKACGITNDEVDNVLKILSDAEVDMVHDFTDNGNLMLSKSFEYLFTKLSERQLFVLYIIMLKNEIVSGTKMVAMMMYGARSVQIASAFNFVEEHRLN